ncbi:hypothetical protein HBA55_18010 [Pseudomaricurvus alkylphenolicus]|jgi:DMSO reductase family type II enzyme heme b subunit|uniref:ethylbenzene dehydrogenase-related protein n=1 Tax=Pseudomaricurvus alkylphenolicus TaxID=1306991 RepID=UPI0014204540|nr:ethylbenzene dehydrogenase-related protein [Pseudomaricurvus alkylphenolicus]NIB41503.1 hypothetical protein [Pseudomaricurvus alkylphenolicus]
MQVQSIKQLDPWRDPKADLWRGVEVESVPLMATPLPMQPTEYIREKWKEKPYGQTPSVDVQVVRDEREIAFHLSWFSGSKHGKDAAAIALPVKGNPILVMMGSRTDPIHFLHWRNDGKPVRSTFSEGIGSTRPGAEVLPGAEAHWSDGRWRLVITRALGRDAEVAPLIPGQPTKVGFAIWNGANDERAGLKAFSIDWKELHL